MTHDAAIFVASSGNEPTDTDQTAINTCAEFARARARSRRFSIVNETDTDETCFFFADKRDARHAGGNGECAASYTSRRNRSRDCASAFRREDH